jgi:aquaporin Z
MKRYLAELVGTFVLVFGGCGSAVLAGEKIGFAGVAFAFGLSLLAMVYAIGPISGCHLNPAVTVGLLLGKKMQPRDAPGYLVAQVIGAIFAAGVLLLIAQGGPGPYDPSVAGFAANGYGAHSPGHYTLTAAFLVEVVLTAFLVLTVLGATAVEAPVGFAGIPIGFVLVLIHLVGIPVTNTSVNPARSIGPAVFVGGWALSQLWLFIAAPLIGAALAAAVYRGIALPTPELPPREAEQALPSEQLERQPLSVRGAEQALPSEQRERHP